MRHLHESHSVQAPSDLLVGIPASLDEAILKAISINPRERFANCRDFALAVEKNWDIVAALLSNRNSTLSRKVLRTNRPVPNSETYIVEKEKTDLAPKRKIKLSRVMRKDD